MKISFQLWVILCIGTWMHSQGVPDALLQALPPVPAAASICGTPAPERQAFKAKVAKVLTLLDDRIRLSQQQEAETAKAAKNKAKVKAAAEARPSDALEELDPEERKAWEVIHSGTMSASALQDMTLQDAGPKGSAEVSKGALERLAQIGRVKDKFKALDEEYRLLRLAQAEGDDSAPAKPSAEVCADVVPNYLSLLTEQLEALRAAWGDFQPQSPAKAPAPGAVPSAPTEALKELRDYVAAFRDIYKFND